jgi:spermidine synthase
MKEIIPKVDVPEGAQGEWAVERFIIDEAGAKFFNLRERLAQIQHGIQERPVVPGTYTRLMRGNDVVMSDTDAERDDHALPVKMADGDCLIMGLGLGMVANAILLKNKDNTVTVVERDPDVASLVAPHYRKRFGGRFKVIEGDALTLMPKTFGRKHWSVIWHDIWDVTCTDNLPEMRKLERRWKAHCKWQGCWGRWDCLQQKCLGY